MTLNPVPAADPGDDLPESWSQSARETYEAVEAERPDLSASEAAALWHACALETAADALDARAAEDGYVALGSTGQLVAHPAAVEGRLARTAAATILARLTPAATVGQTNSQRGRAAARARWSGKAPS